MTEVQKQRLLKVKEQILAEPELYDQGSFGNIHHPCVSPSCLGGWLIWNENPDPKAFGESIRPTNWELAYQLIGIERYKYGLFGTGICWPEPYVTRLSRAKTAKSRAKVAAAMIDYVIANEEEECRRNIQNKN